MLTFTAVEVRTAIKLALEQSEQGADFVSAVTAMNAQGVAVELGSRVYNLLPVMCGRALMQGGGPQPSFSDHYVVRDEAGNRVLVKYSECGVCRLLAETIRELPHLPLVVGPFSCEMLSVNDVLNMLGPSPTAEQIRGIRVLPTEMGGEPLAVQDEPPAERRPL